MKKLIFLLFVLGLLLATGCSDDSITGGAVFVDSVPTDDSDAEDSLDGEGSEDTGSGSNGSE